MSFKIVRNHTPKDGYFRVDRTIKYKYFKGKFEGWSLYEEFTSNTGTFLLSKSKDFVCDRLGFSESNWRKACDHLQTMGFLRGVDSNTGKFFEFSSIPVEVWKQEYAPVAKQKLETRKRKAQKEKERIEKKKKEALDESTSNIESQKSISRPEFEDIRKHFLPNIAS